MRASGFIVILAKPLPKIFSCFLLKEIADLTNSTDYADTPLKRLITRPAETAWRSLAKAVSWRATGSIDTFVLAYLFTGQAKVAAAISGTEIITKIALYFVHERLWQRLAPGRVDKRS